MSIAFNIRWVGAAQAVKVFVQILNITLLARLIAPSEHGIMAIALVIINVGMIIRDQGIPAAIIQKKSIDHALISSIFWFNIYVSSALFAVMAISSKFIAAFFAQEQLTMLLIYAALTFPLSSVSSVHQALLERESQFKAIAIIEMVSAVTSVLVAIVMAYQGYGVYSLATLAIASNLISAVLFWFKTAWLPGWQYLLAMSRLKDVFSFSLYLFLFNIINNLSRNADKFLLGKFMAVATLGAYNLAYRIMQLPLQNISQVISRALYPVMSREQDNPDVMKNAYLNSVFLVILIVVPMMTLLTVFREPLVALVLGPNWSLTADILLWLAPTAIIQAVPSLSGNVFMAKAETRKLMVLGSFGALIFVAGFLLGIGFDIVTFAMIYCFVSLLNTLVVLQVTFKLLGIRITDLVSRFSRLFLLILGWLLILVGCRYLDLQHYLETNVLMLSAVMFFALALYGFGSIMILPECRRYVSAVIK